MGAGLTPAGWYPDVERPGGERYWDGSRWTEHRRGGDLAAAQPPRPPEPGGAAYGAPAAYGSPAGYVPYGVPGSVPPRSAVAGWALGLSIAGLVLTCCGGILLSIPGTVMGWTQMKAIDRGERDAGSRGTAKAAFIVGIIGMALFASLLFFWAIAVVVGET